VSFGPDNSWEDAEALAEAFRAAGFVEVGFKRMMFGAVALHWGVKPK
ncbi:MAG: class I SAM-dependent methyltransferase, partial [Anaerolineales bacterium]